MARPHKKYIEIAPSQFNDLPDYLKCTECGYMSPKDAIVEAFGTCPRCGAYHRLGPTRRVALHFDLGTFEEWFAGVEGTDPLEFPGYEEKLERLRQVRPATEAVLCGKASVRGQVAAFGIMDPRFLMGSMGSGVGERLSQLFTRATEERLPVVIFASSGGARMQEGLVSLMQMAKVSCAVQRHHEAGLFYLSIICDPTTGGVTASFAMQGDVIIAEPDALLGFAGRRVVEGTVGQSLPDDFQTAEFALKHGIIDAIVPREDLDEVISQLIALHTRHADLPEGVVETFLANAGLHDARAELARQKRIARAAKKKRDAEKAAKKDAKGAWKLLGTMRDGVAQPADKGMAKQIAKTAKLDEVDTRAWEKVGLARRTDRPTSAHYLNHLVEGFFELHGDRNFADDSAIVAGLGFIDGMPVTVISQEKGTNTAERVAHNFGCTHPEGYRKVARLARQAEKFGRPVVCLVDTQGAHCDAASEERGQGSAIAECLTTFAGLRVPVVSVIISEGGSGGALAMALGDRVAMMQNAVYSILSPEGFASILWKDASRAAEAAAVMRPTAADALEMGIIDAVIPEVREGAHEHPEEAAAALCAYVKAQLAELKDVPVEELIAARQERFAKIGL